MVKKKHKNTRLHLFDYGGGATGVGSNYSSLGNQYRSQGLFPGENSINTWQPSEQINTTSTNTNGANETGSNAMATASQIGGLIGMFDSLAQTGTAAIDSSRRGVSNQPQVLVEGVLGGQSGSHLGNMWNTGAKTAEAINYVNQMGNATYNGSDTAQLLAQHQGVGQVQSLNIDTRGKELEDFAFDPASWLLTKALGLRESASNRQKRINDAINAVNVRQESAYNDAVKNFEKKRAAQIAMNYMAFGGPIYDFNAFGGGAIGYDIARDNIIAKQIANQNKGTTSTGTISTFANGGLLSDNFTNGVVEINAGGTHEQNPKNGVQFGLAPDGLPNLVEEGEVVYKDYVYSDRLRVPEAIRKKYKLRGPKNMTHAEAMEAAQKESNERENDPISKNGLDNIAMVLAQSQEMVKAEKASHKKAKGGHLLAFGVDEYDPSSMTPEEYYRITGKWPMAFAEPSNWTTEGMERIAPQTVAAAPQVATAPIMQTAKPVTVATVPQDTKTEEETVSSKRPFNPGKYAVPFANATAVMMDTLGITNKHTPTNIIPNYGGISFNPVSTYVPEAHFDLNYAANQAAQQAAATRNAIMNTTAVNRFAPLLAADYNAQIAEGDLRRKAALDAYDNLLKAKTFNRATDQYNSEMGLKAAAEDYQQKLAYANAKLNEFNNNENRSNMSWGARGKNAEALAVSLANMAREEDAYNWRDMLLRAGVFGTLSEKPDSWSDADWKKYQDGLKGQSKSKGGKLKKKRGLTY